MTIFKFGICTICSGVTFFSCDSTPEKTAPTRHIVEIKAMKFEPANLVVNCGDTVVWINRDIVAHDVAEEQGKTWSSAAMSAGASWSLVATKTANYYCTIHVVMKGKIVVQ